VFYAENPRQQRHGQQLAQIRLRVLRPLDGQDRTGRQRVEWSDPAGPSSAAEIKSGWQLRVMRRATAIEPADVQVSVTGDVPSGTAEYAQAKIATAAGHVRAPILQARARITVHQNPAVRRPVVAEANLDINGTPVRAQVDAPTAREAVDLLEARLRRRLDRLARYWQAKRSRTPVESNQWRQAEQTSRLADIAREPGERRIIRRKSFTIAPTTIDDAAFEMDTMDYDFHLFTEAGSGQDSVIYRAGPTGLRVAQVNPAPAQLNSFSAPASISPQPAPLLSVDEAAEQLSLRGLPFLFYLDAEHARGCVLYRRYDGHYGLISPMG
jgi:ribosome-associated translation inhibitor RaiA